MAVPAANFHGVRHLAIDPAVAVRVLGEMTVDAMHADVQMDRRHVHRLVELLGIVRADHVAIGAEQVALPVLLEYRPEIPAVAVVVGELGVFELWIEVRDPFQERFVAPLAASCRAFRIAHVDLAHLGCGRVALLFRPHERGVGFIIPHGVAEEGVQEHIRLMHVADHALAGRDRPGEFVLQRMAWFLLWNHRIAGQGLAVVARAGIRPGVPRIAVVGVDHVTAGAAGRAIVARLLVGAEEPHMWVVQPRLVEVEHRHRDPEAGGRAPVRLAEVGPARLLQPLNVAADIGQADLRKQVEDVAAAALEHPEDVARRDHLPGRQRRERGQDATVAHRVGRRRRAQQLRGHPVAGIGFADIVVLERQDAVVVGRAAPEHGAGRHQAALGGDDKFQVAGTACLPHHPVVARVDEPDVFRGLLVEQREAVLRVGAGGVVPSLREPRLNVRLVERGPIFEIVSCGPRRAGDRRVAAMAIDAAKLDGRVRVHRRLIGLGMAADAASTLGAAIGRGLEGGRRRGLGVGDVARRFAAARGNGRASGGQRQSQSKHLYLKRAQHRARQKVSSKLMRTE